MITFKLVCGCERETHAERWVKLCAQHETEYQERHAAAMAARQAQRELLQEAA